MKRALARASLALLVILATPVLSLAADETIMDWVFRLLRWAAGGWHNY